VDEPQEPTRARIVPLFPHAPMTSIPARRPARSRLDDRTTPDGEMTDRLLRIEAVTGDLPGEDDGLRHVRAVTLGVSSGAFYPHTATEDVPFIAAERGLTTIEVMLQTPGEYAPAFIARLGENAHKAGVTIFSVHTMEQLHPMLDRYPRRAEEGRALFRQGIEAASTLGAEVLVWHGARRRQVLDPAGWERFLALTRELAVECGEAGVTLGLENHAISALGQVRDIADFAKRLGEIGNRREIGFVFDPFQAAEAGANPFMMLAAMGNRIVNVHISDYSEEHPGKRHLPPGDGDLPWSALVRAIAGSGYSGPMMIEGPLGEDETTVNRVRERLNPLIRSVFPFSPDEHRESDGGPRELPEGVRKGIALFNQRRFYEQHEVIEAEWHAERGEIRALYQGILQVGVGFYHALNGNHRGAVALLADGLEKLSRFQPVTLGIDVETFVTNARSCLEEIVALGPEELGTFDPSHIPHIMLTPSDNRVD
jgi:sugar phosphate isomerase/epimerase